MRSPKLACLQLRYCPPTIYLLNEAKLSKHTDSRSSHLVAARHSECQGILNGKSRSIAIVRPVGALEVASTQLMSSALCGSCSACGSAMCRLTRLKWTIRISMWRMTHFPNGMPQAADPVLKRVPTDTDSLSLTVDVVEWARFCSHVSG